MKTDSGATVSVWMRTADVPAEERLTGETSADVCVVGAGIAGLTTAYLLVHEGRSVVVLDDGPIAGGETSRTTAHLTCALDDRFTELERLHGERGARLAGESHAAAIDRIEAIIAAEGIECDFTRLDGYLFNPPDQQDEEFLKEELAAAHRAGLTEAEMVARAPLADFDTGPAICFPRQGQFHILKYLAGLSAAIKRRGGRIFTGTHADKIEGGPEARVTAGDARVNAQAIVVATNSPVNDLVAIHTKQAPYRTYVIGARIPRDSVPRALYWDTLDPYHYVRLQRMGAGADSYDLLIVGGEDHKTGQTEEYAERHARLEAWTRERFPQVEAVEFRWSGQVMEPFDGLAFIGQNPLDADNVYIATGDSGQGMTHGTIAGLLLTDLIMGRENEWAGIYDPSRKTLSAAGEFAKENFNVAAQYTDLVTPGEVASLDEIARGAGAIVRRGLSKVAVYRDEEGLLHERSAICAHLGCVVAWNPLEQSWDCPCHGSRYGTDGHVLNGPAIKPLAPVEE